MTVFRILYTVNGYSESSRMTFIVESLSTFRRDLQTIRSLLHWLCCS